MSAGSAASCDDIGETVFGTSVYGCKTWVAPKRSGYLTKFSTGNRRYVERKAVGTSYADSYPRRTSVGVIWLRRRHICRQHICFPIFKFLFLNFFNSFSKFLTLDTHLIYDFTLNLRSKYLPWSNFLQSHPSLNCSSPARLTFIFLTH